MSWLRIPLGLGLIPLRDPQGTAEPPGAVLGPLWQLLPAQEEISLIYGRGSRCLFLARFPFIPPPEPRSFLPQEPPGARNCPVGARASDDTQGLKIVTAVHPTGPGICSLIYE